MAKDKHGSCHCVEPIFHFGNRGITPGWEALEKVGSLAWISCVLQGKNTLLLFKACKSCREDRSPGQSSRLQGMAGACRVDTAEWGRGSEGWVSFTGEAKSILKQLLGSDGREGWVDVNGEPNWQHINGWRPRCSGRKPSGGRRCAHHHLLQLKKQPGPPHHSEGDTSHTSNRNDNSGLNSEPQMPPSLMGYWHTTKCWGFSGTGRGRGRRARASLELPTAHPPELLKHCPWGAPHLGHLPCDTAELVPSPTCLPQLYPLPGRGRGSALQGLLLSGLRAGTARATQTTLPSCLSPHLQPAPPGQPHWCHFEKVTAVRTHNTRSGSPQKLQNQA